MIGPHASMLFCIAERPIQGVEHTSCGAGPGKLPPERSRQEKVNLSYSLII